MVVTQKMQHPLRQNASNNEDDNIYTPYEYRNNPQKYIWEHGDLIYLEFDHECEQNRYNQTPLEVEKGRDNTSRGVLNFKTCEGIDTSYWWDMLQWVMHHPNKI
jgi:hypothetical protein